MSKFLRLFNLWRWNRHRVNDAVVDDEITNRNLDRLLAVAYPPVQASEVLHKRVAATLPVPPTRASAGSRRLVMAGIVAVAALCVGGVMTSLVTRQFSVPSLATPQVVLQIWHRGATSIAFSPDGQIVASGGVDQTVRLWDARTGLLKQTLTGGNHTVYSIAFSPDGKTLVGGMGGWQAGEVRVWNVATGQLQRTPSGHRSLVYAVAFSPDSKSVASAGGDGTVRLWDIQTGKLQWMTTRHANRVRAVAFSPDGKTVASGSEDRTIRLWDAKTGALRQTLEGHQDAILSVAFSPDGKTLASGGVKTRFVDVSGEVKLWDAQTGELKRTLPGRIGVVYAVAFSPDGRWLAGGGESGDVYRASGDIRVWETKTEKMTWWTRIQPNLPQVSSNLITSLAFSPDGKRLASASHDGIVRIWSLQNGEQTKGSQYAMLWTLGGRH